MDYPSDSTVGLIGGKFGAGDPTTGVKASKVWAPWANAVTDEVLAVIVAGGLTPAEGTVTQLRDAINVLITNALAGGAGILNAGGTPSIQSGLAASRPAAGQVGRIWFSTDSLEISQDSGTVWKLMVPFPGALASSGFVGIKIPVLGTLLINWLVATNIPANSNKVFTLPVTFATSAFGAVVASSDLVQAHIDMGVDVTLTTATVRNDDSNQVASAFVIAFGI